MVAGTWVKLRQTWELNAYLWSSSGYPNAMKIICIISYSPGHTFHRLTSGNLHFYLTLVPGCPTAPARWDARTHISCEENGPQCCLDAGGMSPWQMERSGMIKLLLTPSMMCPIARLPSLDHDTASSSDFKNIFEVMIQFKYLKHERDKWLDKRQRALHRRWWCCWTAHVLLSDWD